MPGLLRSLAKAAIDGYMTAQAQSQAAAQQTQQQQQQQQQYGHHSQQSNHPHYQQSGQYAHPQWAPPAPVNQGSYGQQHGWQGQQYQTQHSPQPQQSQAYSPPPQQQYIQPYAQPQQQPHSPVHPVQQQHQGRSQPQTAHSPTYPQRLPHEAEEDGPPPYEEFDLHPSPAAQAPPVPQRPQASASPTAVDQRSSIGAPQHSTQGFVHAQTHTRSPGCNGYESIIGGSIYVTSVAPELDFCPSCYSAFIANSPFSSRFSLVADTSQGGKCCDMATKAIRDAWKEACARASNADLQDQAVWLQRFAQQARDMANRIRDILVKAQALKEQIDLGQLQTQYVTASSMQQIRHGCVMQSIARMDLSRPTYYTDGYSAITAAGNNRFHDAQQMRMNLIMQQAELEKLLAEVKTLTGCDDKGKPTWA
ncbi:hypothetical protein AMS68_001925 [Peltaster fructicola]|uniref:Uncharacterized protein n=1 Tax=Peltaster fructicola TaxID=286661 RepID=A0A6H0XP52_9PEZI|nr:hypothetical protein AMS68_001925 [Peltaster fructicola]